MFDLITDAVNRGIHVNLGKLGTMGVTADTQGVVKPTFRASNALRTAVKAYGGKFKNAANKGLNDEGFAQTWLKNNLNDTVIMRDGTSRTRTHYGL
ncbi:MAG TPA: hypothetical protein PK530_03760 [Anaerolineales bacterium]|nr:hypothetical protein [Anaerolineales bacterium]